MSDEGEKTAARGLVVGIGASAGGLEAFTSFFANLTPQSGMAFVLVQHLSPDHGSILGEILTRYAPIPVIDAQHDMLVTADCIYVIPPDATLTIKDGRLVVVKPAPPRSTRRPIDSFFLSLAADQGSNAVSIVLAGVGSDGSAGLAAIKEAGGLTIAQAEYDHHAMPGMPQNAYATGLVDLVLPVEAMAGKLIDYRDHLARTADGKNADGTWIDDAGQLAAVLAVLRAKTGQDFAQYKSRTVTRRIQRRMQVLQVDSFAAYLDRLKNDPAEPELLFRDLLIGVTEFFRDEEAFTGLSAVLDGVIQRNNGERLRVWVPACSTGEEVYSLAILIRELMDTRGANLDVQIFGTDIDDRAVEVARAGRYQRTTGISPERLKRWFFQSEGAFCPSRRIRIMCVFSVHNVTRDPPFSKLDLISCRNLMIYMDSELQRRVLRTFQYALKVDGLLFLGQSEGVSGHAGLFTLYDKAAHIYQRRGGDAAFPILPVPLQGTVPDRLTVPTGRAGSDRIDRSVRLSLARHSPAFVVVDHDCNILRYSGAEVARYLEPAPGVASLALLSNLRKGLRVAVRTALQSAMKSNEGVIIDDVVVVVEGRPRVLSVIIEPILDAGNEGLFVVAFRDTPVPAAEPMPVEPGPSGQPTLAQERELRATREQLQSTIGDLETANEEMKSAAEEYQSVNEELQSTNEELQTSKEEMQSINEELQTVNAEMMSKNEMLSTLNSDLQNLLDSTQIATIFLDEALRIKNFTPGMTGIFSLRETDRGRPHTDIVSLLAYDDLSRDVAKVLRELTVVERELVLTDRASTFVMRIRPYCSIERMIDGVVITFVDVTDRRNAERAKDISERRYTAIVGQATVGVAECDPAGRFLLTNLAFETTVGRSARDLQQMFRRDLIDPEDVDAVMRRYDQADRDQRPFEIEYRLLRSGGSVVWVHDSVSVINDGDGAPNRMISVTLEINQRKRAEEQAGLLLGELDHRVKNILAIVSSIVAQTLKTTPSPEDFAATIFGRIAAIARAHSLLTDQGAAGAGGLRATVETELEPFQGRGLIIDGPIIILTPKAGLSLAMALHELASNAAKYGSLSDPNGRLSVSWTLTASAPRRLILNWTESGGPPVAGPPARRGFGTTLIERSLGYEFDAKVDRQFAPTGVVCIINLSFTAAVGELRLVDS